MLLLDKLEQTQGRDMRLSQEEAETLLALDERGTDFHRLLALSDRLSREKFGNRGYVFAQIGINAEPCSKNCLFCSMGRGHYVMDAAWQKEIPEILAEVEGLLRENIDDLFLMTTADFPQETFLKTASAVRGALPDHVRLVANIGDFSLAAAHALKRAGCTGAYHICRLREGRDTGIELSARERTLEAVNAAGLELYYCLEPIGPEHTRSELATEMLRARKLGVQAMAAMRRVPVPGTPLAAHGRISALELTKMAAVANLAVNPGRCMNVHEPMQMPLLAGVNQLYAESGANPRDTRSLTEKGRGFSPAKVWELLAEGGWFAPKRT